LTGKTKGAPHHVGTYALDPAKRPKELDLVEPNGGGETEVTPAIYELEGDSLKVAFSRDGPRGKRSAGFDAQDIVVITLKRQKS
jgi:uncharacterized protein (TIGR03067 family)